MSPERGNFVRTEERISVGWQPLPGRNTEGLRIRWKGGGLAGFERAGHGESSRLGDVVFEVEARNATRFCKGDGRRINLGREAVRLFWETER